MKQLITNFKISLVNYLNDSNFPSYETRRNNPILTNQNIITDFDKKYNISTGTTTIDLDSLHTFTLPIYLYIREINNNLFKVNDSLIVKEFLINSIYPNGQITNNLYDIIITPTDMPLLIEYYVLN